MNFQTDKSALIQQFLIDEQSVVVENWTKERKKKEGICLSLFLMFSSMLPPIYIYKPKRQRKSIGNRLIFTQYLLRISWGKSILRLVNISDMLFPTRFRWCMNNNVLFALALWVKFEIWSSSIAWDMSIQMINANLLCGKLVLSTISFTWNVGASFTLNHKLLQSQRLHAENWNLTCERILYKNNVKQ